MKGDNTMWTPSLMPLNNMYGETNVQKMINHISAVYDEIVAKANSIGAKTISVVFPDSPFTGSCGAFVSGVAHHPLTNGIKFMLKKEADMQNGKQYVVAVTTNPSIIQLPTLHAKFEKSAVADCVLVAAVPVGSVKQSEHTLMCLGRVYAAIRSEN